MNDIKEFASELRDDLPELDLHGFYPEDIQTKIDQFLFENVTKKETAVRIIFGVGTGKLHDTGLVFLQNHPLVEKVIDKGAACVVLLVTNLNS